MKRTLLSCSSDPPGGGVAGAQQIPLQILANDATVGPRDVLEIKVLEEPDIDAAASSSAMTARSSSTSSARSRWPVSLPRHRGEAQDAARGELPRQGHRLRAGRRVRQQADLRRRRRPRVPGRIGATGNTTLIQAITQAGGLAAGYGRSSTCSAPADNGLSEQVAIDDRRPDGQRQSRPEHPARAERPRQRPGRHADHDLRHGRSDQARQGRRSAARRRRPLLQAIAAAGGPTDRAASDGDHQAAWSTGRSRRSRSTTATSSGAQARTSVLQDNDTVWSVEREPHSEASVAATRHGSQHPAGSPPLPLLERHPEALEGRGRDPPGGDDRARSWPATSPSRCTSSHDPDPDRAREPAASRSRTSSASPPSEQEFLQTQYVLLKSRGLADARDRRPQAPQRSRVLSRRRRRARRPQEIQQIKEGMRRRAPRRQSTSRPVRNTSLVDISYVGTSPRLAQKIAEAWGESFIRMNIAKKLESVQQASEFLQPADRRRAERPRAGPPRAARATGRATASSRRRRQRRQRHACQRSSSSTRDVTTAQNDRLSTSRPRIESLQRTSAEAVAATIRSCSGSRAELAACSASTASKRAQSPRRPSGDESASREQIDKTRSQRASADRAARTARPSSQRAPRWNAAAAHETLGPLRATKQQRGERSAPERRRRPLHRPAHDAVETKQTLLGDAAEAAQRDRRSRRALRGSASSNIHWIDHAQLPGGRFNLIDEEEPAERVPARR